MILTSYYGMHKELAKDTRVQMISISRTVPAGIQVTCNNLLQGRGLKRLDCLVPPQALVNAVKGSPTNTDALLKLEEYDRTNLNINPLELARRIKELSPNRIPVLMCWEGIGKPCHRHLVTDFLWRSINMNSMEFSKGSLEDIKVQELPTTLPEAKALPDSYSFIVLDEVLDALLNGTLREKAVLATMVYGQVKAEVWVCITEGVLQTHCKMYSKVHNMFGFAYATDCSVGNLTDIYGLDDIEDSAFGCIMDANTVYGYML